MTEHLPIPELCPDCGFVIRFHDGSPKHCILKTPAVHGETCMSFKVELTTKWHRIVLLDSKAVHKIELQHFLEYLDGDCPHNPEEIRIGCGECWEELRRMSRE